MVFRTLPIVVAVTAAALVLPAAAQAANAVDLTATAAAPATTAFDLDGTATEIAVPTHRADGTQCDPRDWAQPAAGPCTLAVLGRWSAAGAVLGAVHGTYTGRLTITTAGHAPGCLETSGTLTYVARDSAGRLLGRIVAPLDAADSEVCQHAPASRTYFLRADAHGGTGVFARATGNWLVTGSGGTLGGHGVFVNHLTVSGQFTG